MQAYNNIQDTFPILTTDNQDTNKVFLFFGVKNLNKESIDRWNPNDLGKVEMIGDIDISDVASQISL